MAPSYGTWVAALGMGRSGVDPSDLAYLLTVGFVGGLARALGPLLPVGWRQRLDARPVPVPGPGWIWIHAVSVGELLLAEGLLVRLRKEGARLHVTTGTPAGLALLRQRLGHWDGGMGRVTGGAFPLDDPAGLAPFFEVPPSAFIALETELWPNLLRELERRQIPRIVVNGRLTFRSLQKGGPWICRAARRLSLVAARDPESGEAFRKLGAPRVELGGNLKADTAPPRELHEGWVPLRRAWIQDPVLVAGNTLAGEEALVLGAWARAREEHPGLRLILAPRQPRRFDEVAAWLETQGHPFLRASGVWPDQKTSWEGVPILLLDTLGELPAAFGEGTLAPVGGGWAWDGGHNPLEPVRWGLPPLLGPGYRKFTDLVEPLLREGLVEVVENSALEDRVLGILRSSNLRGGKAWGTSDLPAELRGALGITMNFVKDFLQLPR